MVSKQKHILILSSWYPTEQSPYLGNFIERQASLLSTEYQVTLLDIQTSDVVQEPQVKTFDHKGFREVIVHYQKGSTLITRKRYADLALQMGFALVENVDLIIGNILLPKGLIFASAKKHFDCPLIYVEHGSYFRAEERKKWGWKERVVLKSVKKYADGIVAVSPALREDMKADFSNSDISIIGNHIDMNLFDYVPKEQSDITRFLHVSTLDNKTKNPIGIIEACAILKETTDKFELTIVSDEDPLFLEESVRIKKLGEQVKFVGPQRWEDMPPFYQKADAFVLFSDYESFSIVVAEAWATGTPVISTSVGIAQHMPDFLGVNVQIRNPQALAQAMLGLIEGEKHYEPSEIREYAHMFSQEGILKRWNDLIHKYAK